jgi:hypothetical protein
MKNTVFACLVLLAVAGGCTQKQAGSTEPGKIENTLKSVSFVYDSVGMNPSELLSMFESVNRAIDSIGYPNAGYKLWLIQGDSARDFRFLVEGYWPDQAIYDSIHANKLYQDAWSAEDKAVWNKFRTVSYHRFTLVK